MINEAARERDIERYLGRKLKSLGCLYLKFVSPGNVGVPDRIVVLPDGQVVFAELKTVTGKLSEPQKLMLRRLQEHHAEVHVLYGMAGADLMVRDIALRLGGDAG